jgi:protein-tyrosine-phosphatase
MALASDLIITMTRKHKEAIVKKLPMLSDKVLTLEEAAGGGEGDIEDPIGGDLDDYRAVRNRILGCMGRTVARLKEGKL